MRLPSESSPTTRHWFLLSGAAFVYILFVGLNYLTDPLGQVPVLDARENLAWAGRIAQDALPAEPLYRALLYPWLLSVLPASSIVLLASVAGFGLHVLSSIWVGLIAKHLWRQASAAWAAGLLYAIYPVALYFAGQILDITFSMTLFLAAVYGLLRAMDADSKLWQSLLGLGAGLLAGLTVLARPNFLPAVLLFPCVVLWARSRPWLSGLGAATGILAMLLLQGAYNHQQSGEFRLLPWQGAYNLYAANQANANGKYFKQTLAFDHLPAGTNTTRMESEILYREANGAEAPLTVDAMNAHWREQVKQHVLENPLGWLGLMGRKAVYTLNNWEQYNNLTYAYHKARWPVLRWNPLGWGILLVAAFVGLLSGGPSANRPALYGIACLGLAYAAGLMLFFVSARFRLPLAPLLCVAAGGCVFAPQCFHRGRGGLLLVGALLLGVLSFGNWFQARDRKTFIQDQILLAKASSTVGEDLKALGLARAVLDQSPGRPEAERLVLTSLFNLWLSSGTAYDWEAVAATVPEIEARGPAVEFIRGVYFWRGALNPEQAIDVWQAAVDQYGAAAQSSLDALQAVGHLDPDPGRAQALESMRQILAH